MGKIKAWHFAIANNKGQPILGFGDGREIIDGSTLSINGPINMCKNGLHGSVKILDALGYASGPIITRVEISGDIIIGHNKIVGRNRKCLWHYSVQDSEELLRYFTRMSALYVADKWDCPDVVYEYLLTARNRAAAWAAARAAARDAAWAAARAAARAAAWAAAWDAAWDELNNYLEMLVNEPNERR